MPAPRLRSDEPGSDAAKAKGCVCLGMVWGRTKATRRHFYAVYDDYPAGFWHLWALSLWPVGSEEFWQGGSHD